MRLAADRLPGPPVAYRPTGPDAMLASDGTVRPHWAGLVADLSSTPPAELAARFAAAERHLVQSGVYYRVYEGTDGHERPWPLAPVPLVLSAAEWRTIAAGVTQRAELIDRVLSDLHGPATLVREGIVPAAVVAASPGFLRPLVGTTPRGGRWLTLYAADLARTADGGWTVLGDRTQAPSGIGYALENRLAVAEAFPHRADPAVERLSGFVALLRDTLAGLSGHEGVPGGARVGLLTPGPANETWFEHAYLARTLGFLLVEGGDLAVQDGTLHVRTVEGLKRLDVVLRRLDADFADPLELTPERGGISRLGVPGLVGAVRAGRVALANALGSGLAEAPALRAYLPAASRRLLGEALRLPSPLTLWCGEPGHHAAILARAGLARSSQLALRPAFGRLPPTLSLPDGAPDPVAHRRAVQHLLETRGLALVAEEAAALSTMPAWAGQGAGLEPRPFVLRVFALATPAGWQVMPGGFARVAAGTDTDGGGLEGLSMQRGGHSADVWVEADPAGPRPSAQPAPPASVAIRRRPGALPSRAADNLYWLGRYLERTEATLRVASSLARLSDGEAGTHEAARRLAGLLVAWGALDEADAPAGPPVPAMLAEVLGGQGSGALPALLASAGRTASLTRERLPSDALRQLDALRAWTDDAVAGAPKGGRPKGSGPKGRTLRDGLAEGALPTDDLQPDGPIPRLLGAIGHLHGLLHENMTRGAGWRFLEVGRRLERAVLTGRIARRLGFAAERTEDEAASLDALLGLVDSRLTYRTRYLMGARRAPVLDLVLLDGAVPRSMAFSVERLAEHLARLADPDGAPDASLRAAHLVAGLVEGQDAASLDEAWVLGIENRLLALSDEVTARYFGTGTTPDGGFGPVQDLG